MYFKLVDTESQADSLTKYRNLVRETKANKTALIKTKLDTLYQESDSSMQRCLDLANEKGSSIWLNTLPIEKMGYSLNKQEFLDAVALRYSFPICGVASHCACGKINSLDHTLVCKLGGYTIMRHNEVRDTEADLLREVCRDVRIEPQLMPLSGQQFSRSANHECMARLDISSRGFWNPMEKAFFDVRIFHPNADSNRSRALNDLYSTHEREKKRAYNDRVIQVEHATFTPLVFSTSGGEAPECKKYHQRLATLISLKRREKYSETIAYICRKVRFCMLRTTLIAIRGFRKSTKPPSIITPFCETDIAVSEQAHH